MQDIPVTFSDVIFSVRVLTRLPVFRRLTQWIKSLLKIKDMIVERNQNGFVEFHCVSVGVY